MAAELRRTFAICKKAQRPAFVAFLTAGFPDFETTVPALKGLQDGGADIIELGLPFSDPLADGGAIQKANTIALAKGISVIKVIELVRAARKVRHDGCCEDSCS
jgi:tryptophan synthase